jgi:hypothetical protein
MSSRQTLLVVFGALFALVTRCHPDGRVRLRGLQRRGVGGSSSRFQRDRVTTRTRNPTLGARADRVSPGGSVRHGIHKRVTRRSS